jgi:hypothetical protein
VFVFLRSLGLHNDCKYYKNTRAKTGDKWEYFMIRPFTLGPGLVVESADQTGYRTCLKDAFYIGLKDDRFGDNNSKRRRLITSYEEVLRDLAKEYSYVISLATVRMRKQEGNNKCLIH